MWMQRETKRALPLFIHPPLSLPPVLPETASLSPTAAKSVKHHTASMIFTYFPGLQHREPQHVTNPADEKDRNPHSRDDGEAREGIC